MDQFNDTATGPPSAVNYATPNAESAPLVAAFVPDPAETFEAMVARLTGRDLPGPRNPVTTLLYHPPYTHPDAATARELERLYPGQVVVRYGAPMTYYLVGKERLTFSYVEAEPGFPPLPDETAADYLTRHLEETRLPGGSSWIAICAGGGPTVADARALQAQDPEGVFIGFGKLTGRYILKIQGRACFMFPEAEDDGRGADIPLNGGEVEL